MQTLFLDGTLKANLDWQQQQRLAEDAIRSHERLFWHIDLGLFASLTLPLRDQAQYLALKLSLEHFRNTIWEPFRDYTDGVSIYRGTADYGSLLMWDPEQISALQDWLQGHFKDVSSLEQDLGMPVGTFDSCTRSFLEKNETGRHLIRLFARDVAAEYMTLLVNGMPDAMPICLEMNVPFLDPLQQAQLICQERYERFRIMPNNTLWDVQNQEREDVAIGICMPSYQCVQKDCFADINEALTWLIQQRHPFKIIPEAMLSACWDGLDFVLVAPQGISFTGKRKLQGFCAAGGTIVNTGKTSLDITNEVFFCDWLEHLKVTTICK